ncbi:MAG: glycoside hydrolase family 13 protein [Planctomycetota bacterium]|nr:glycoside hydrolase family 13 protein [Planctomycetota bacterium]
MTTDAIDWGNERDRARAPIYRARAADWRVGPVVYHVFVDRFAPPDPARLSAKRGLYAPPRILHDWDEPIARGERLEDLGLHSHELEFWGGDLRSVMSRLDYVQGLGADVLYLNPIHKAFTNHKYDADDYSEVSPEYGTRDDVRALARDLHARGMKLMLDGVFNHMGRSSPMFKDALENPASPYRDWFMIGPEHPGGYLGWANVRNLPELRLENPDVRRMIWDGPESVVRSYLRDGVDGWRLDVAYDLGFKYLAELTAAAHAEKPGSLVIGEIWNDPAEWTPGLDALMNFHARHILLCYLGGKLGGGRAGRLLQRMVDDAGLESMLRGWLVLDNHDTARLKHTIPERNKRRLAQVLQFTLPGAPCVYYGTEVGMEGGDDPFNRASMRWELVSEDNDDLAFFRSLIEMRRRCPALRIGDFRVLDADHMLAFQRRTDRATDTVIVVANASGLAASEVIPVCEPKLANFAPLVDELSGAEFRVHSGTVEVEVPAESVLVLRTRPPEKGYSPLKRVR